MERFIKNDDIEGLQNYIDELSNNNDELKYFYMKKCKYVLNRQTKINYFLRELNDNYTTNDAIKINDFKNLKNLITENEVINEIAEIECFKILVDNFEKIYIYYFLEFKFVDTVEKLSLIFKNKKLLEKLNEKYNFVFDEVGKYSDGILYNVLVHSKKYSLIPFLIENGAKIKNHNLLVELISYNDVKSVAEMLKYNQIITQRDRNLCKSDEMRFLLEKYK